MCTILDWIPSFPKGVPGHKHLHLNFNAMPEAGRACNPYKNTWSLVELKMEKELLHQGFNRFFKYL